MRSKSFDNANTAAQARAFTLIELFSVVVIVALMATVLASGALSMSADRRSGRAMRELVMLLSNARMHAMRTQHASSCEVWFEGERMVASIPGRNVRSWTDLDLTCAGDDSTFTVEFSREGRASARRWIFAIRGDDDSEWMIEFDPLSGSPRVSEPRKEQST